MNKEGTLNLKQREVEGESARGRGMCALLLNAGDNFACQKNVQFEDYMTCVVCYV